MAPFLGTTLRWGLIVTILTNADVEGTDLEVFHVEVSGIASEIDVEMGLITFLQYVLGRGAESVTQLSTM